MMCMDVLRARSNLRRTLQWMMALSVLATLAGCTTASRATSDSFRLLFKRQVAATPEQVAANRFPQAQLKAPDLSAVMVLGYVDAGRQSWYAGSNAVFQLDSTGLVTGVSSPGRQLQARIIGASPFVRLRELNASTTVQREYDWIPSYRMGVQATGTLTRGDIESISILGKERSLVRFDERIEGGFRAHNIYWADPVTGFIWKSRQQLGPFYTVELVQLKPYRPAKD
ncbi:YjbF family lipoprotein [Stenotrophomonas riyadhensis]|uniref:YjbF family lipoprotein n=1 Tax=Stenotrophomonas maltophilia TaxID=40324 RepID=A0AAI9C4D0_STEMA|nr:YjbF family lipoprotein [Stenotrophomonas maltophilia]UUS13457.1 YjbF family lipoprotein [Stenotrophomonas sp. CD2]HEL4101402.1 YjbF family lipoprotein [Stenotrophomonas maltophilia]HEL5043089.1 YjbF family lipoprotein [Stenotrophomonas maltophilia]